MKKNLLSYSLIAILGIVFGILYFIIPLKYLFLGLAGLIGTILVLWKLEIGLFTAVFCLPFAPTMGIVGLTILIIISFIIRAAAAKQKIRFGSLSLWILIFGALILLYSVSSVTPASSIKAAVVILSYIALYFVIINTVKNKRMLYWLVTALILSGSLEALYGIYQYKIGVPTVDENWTDVTMFPEMNTRVFGTLDNPNILAQYLEFIIPIAFGLGWTVKSFFKKAVFFGLAGIMLLCLIFTFSRGGWVAFALSIMVFGALKDRKVLILGGIAGIISLFLLPDVIISRISSIGNLGESSNSYRTFIWASTLNMIRDFWYSGVGVGVEAFSKLYNAVYMREGVFAYHTHNLYLEILAEMGIMGLLSFLTLIFMTFKHGLTAFIKSADNLSKTIIASLLGGMVAFLFHGVSENSFYNFKIVFLFWFVIALVSSIKLIEEKEIIESFVQTH